MTSGLIGDAYRFGGQLAAYYDAEHWLAWKPPGGRLIIFGHEHLARGDARKVTEQCLQNIHLNCRDIENDWGKA